MALLEECVDRRSDVQGSLREFSKRVCIVLDRIGDHEDTALSDPL